MSGPREVRRISGWIPVAGLVVVGCLSIAAAPPNHRPAAPTMKARIIAALGGGPRLDALTALRVTGSMEGISGFPGTYESLSAGPGQRRVAWDIGYLKRTLAIDGNAGWERVAAVRQLAGEELARERRDARFNVLYRLLRSNAPFNVKEGACASGKPVYLLTFVRAGAPSETFGVDRRSFLPSCYVREERYQEGPTEVRTEYDDYRPVGGLMLPFAIRERRPDNSLKIHVAAYELNPIFNAQDFRNPEASRFSDPVDLQLATLPEHIYKEPDGNYAVGPQRYWGMFFYSSESWSLDVVVRERHGRYLEPERATADFYAGEVKIGSQSWQRPALLSLRRYPVARFTPQREIYGFRHNFAFAEDQKINRIVYSYSARAADGRLYRKSLEIPVMVYRPKTRLIFPLKGKFMVTTGHEYYETDHKYERSQQFSIDVVALGDTFEFARNNGARAEDYVGYARRQIIAPAEGRVVFARNDIPDGAIKADFLKLPNAITAPAGNVVIIDHGNQEFSIFCHMHYGSVLVKTGDMVRQGQPIGLIGAAGSPGLPHLHYQLQNGPAIFGNDGLPLIFSNIERVAWLGRRADEDEAGSAPVEQPRSGIFMEAR